jgi:hypothetical protein
MVHSHFKSIATSLSASSPLMGFDELNNNTIIGLTSLLSILKVQQTIIAL